MIYATTTATRRVARLNKKIRAVQGGTSASKTISILIVLIAMAQEDETPTLTSVVSESLPHLKKGAIRDFKRIMRAHRYWKDGNWSETDKIYTFETGSQIEFFGADQSEKLRGGRRDRGFMNEANNLTLAAFDEFEVRTKDFVFLDWNPTNEFWFYEDVKAKRDDVDHIILTYKDNEACPPEIVAAIEARKNRPGWWKVYGEGQLGEIEGKIYPNWTILDEIPKEARLERRYIDFGYTNDPTAIGDIYYWNGSYIVDEHLYQKGLSNKQIAEFLLNLPKCLTIADSAEPKSIDEIRSFGIQIVGSKKGSDSVMHGIQSVKDQNIYVTKRSVNIIKENRNYLFLTDKDGKILNQEDPMCDNHHMAGIRYAITSLVPVMRKQEFAYSIPSYAQKSKSNPAR